MDKDSIKAEALRLTDECLKVALSLNLIKRPKTFTRKFEAKVKQTGGSWGGIGRKRQPRITLSFDRLIGNGNFSEYRHINESKTIGGFESDNPVLPRMALIAHELAHAIDHWNRDTGWGAHKDTWRHLYGSLRRKWVNHLI